MCRRSTSAIWSPTVNTGFSEVIGSWKIIEMSVPRSCAQLAPGEPRAGCARRRGSRCRRRPIAFSGGSSPRIASEVTDLPLPDSPTSATVRVARDVEADALHRLEASWCRSRRNDDPQVAHADQQVRCVLLMLVPRASLELRIERVAQRVGEQAERGDEHRHRRARRGELPPLAEDQLVLRLVEHRAPGHHVDRHAEAEERQDHLGLDEADHEDATAAPARRGSRWGRCGRTCARAFDAPIASAACTYSRALCFRYSARISR